MMSRRRGFTLIELLVVISIIAILAAMLFPVFARARESARKIQCLSNVKNIAMAVQIYFTDYDKFPPPEADGNVNAWFDNCGGNTRPGCCSTQANPYLRWPVIFDEYVKNRDVWRCPSAVRVAYPGAIMPAGDWFKLFSNSSKHYGACCDLWPVGWGGTATDSDQNGACQKPSSATGAVEFSIGMFEHLQGKSISLIHDASRHIVVADATGEPWWGMIEQVAFPDICRSGWGHVVDYGCGADWVNCSDTQSCGLARVDLSVVEKFWTDPSYRKKYARHLGGSNIGFADGHAAWMSADAIIAAAGNHKNPSPYVDLIMGSGNAAPPAATTGTAPPTLEGVNCQCLPKSMW
jgi:prepilin-type N-terminal cleavage/methylation domain-containing protein/prepilin-type processing-associated H-X9-DG protein